MENKDELKEIDIKNGKCYYIEDTRVRDIDFSDIFLDEKSYKTYKNIYFMAFHTKLLWVQNHCILGSMK